MAHKLKNLNLPHLTESNLRLLAQNRIITVTDFLQEDVIKLTALTNLNLPIVLTIRQDIFSKYSAPIVNGCTLLNNCRISKEYISTGIERLDTMLSGGIPSGFITELCGLAGSGKTQLCFQLTLNCVKHSANTVLYIDTKGDFSAVRIQKILQTSGYSVKEMAMMMCKVKVVRIWTITELIDVFQNIKKGAIKIESLALIIIDSLPCLMFQYLGDDNKIGLKLLNIFVNYSRYLCKELLISLICVNIQTRWVGQDVSDLDDDTATTMSTFKDVSYTETRNRCLGKYWQQIPYLVLLLEKTQDEPCDSQIKISVMKSSSMEISSQTCFLELTSLGVT